MKAKFIMAVPVFCILFTSVTNVQTESSRYSSVQQESIIVGVYDGHEDYRYNFITTRKENGSEYTMTFQKINEDVLKEYDLDAELFLNQKFEVTYTTATDVDLDENGLEDEVEIYTIIRLKAL